MECHDACINNHYLSNMFDIQITRLNYAWAAIHEGHVFYKDKTVESKVDILKILINDPKNRIKIIQDRKNKCH